MEAKQAAELTAAADAAAKAAAATAAATAAQAAATAAGESEPASVATANAAAAAASTAGSDATASATASETATDAKVASLAAAAASAATAADAAAAAATAAKTALDSAVGSMSDPAMTAELADVEAKQVVALTAAVDAAAKAAAATAAATAAQTAATAAGESEPASVVTANAAATAASAAGTAATASATASETATDAKVADLATVAANAATAASAAAAAATAAKAALDSAVAALSDPATPAELTDIEAKQAAAQAAAADSSAKASEATAAAIAAQDAAIAANETVPASVATANAGATAASAAGTSASTSATASETATDAKVADLAAAAANAATAATTAAAAATAAKTALDSAVAAMSDPATTAELADVEAKQVAAQTAAVDAAAKAAAATAAAIAAQAAATAANEAEPSSVAIANAAATAASAAGTDATTSATASETATDAKVSDLATVAANAATAATTAAAVATAAKTALDSAVAAMSDPATPAQLADVEAKQAAALTAAADAAAKAAAATAAAIAAQAAATAANEAEPVSVATAIAAATAASAAGTDATAAATASEIATDAKVASLATVAANAATAASAAAANATAAKTALDSAVAVLSDPATPSELADVEAKQAAELTAAADAAAKAAAATAAATAAQAAATAAGESEPASVATANAAAAAASTAGSDATASATASETATDAKVASLAAAAASAATAADAAAAAATAAKTALDSAVGSMSDPAMTAELADVEAKQAAALTAAADAAAKAAAATAAAIAAQAAATAANEAEPASVVTANAAATAANAAGTDATASATASETATDAKVADLATVAANAANAASAAAAAATAAKTALDSAVAALSDPATPAELTDIEAKQAAAQAAAADSSAKASEATAAAIAAQDAAVAANETVPASVATANAGATAASAAGTSASTSATASETATDAKVADLAAAAANAATAATTAAATATAAKAALDGAVAALSNPATSAELAAVEAAQAAAQVAASDAAAKAAAATAAANAAQAAAAAANETVPASVATANAAATAAIAASTDATTSATVSETATDAKVASLATAATHAATAASAAAAAATAAKTALDNAVAALSDPATPAQLADVEAKQVAALTAAADAAAKAQAATAAATAAQAAATAANEAVPASVATANAAATAASAAGTEATASATASETATDAKVADLATAAAHAATAATTAAATAIRAKMALESAVAALSDPATPAELADVEAKQAAAQAAATDAAAQAAAATAATAAQAAATAANETEPASVAAANAASGAAAAAAQQAAAAVLGSSAQADLTAWADLNVYTLAGVAGVGGSAQPSVAMVNSVLADRDITGVQADSAADVQVIVDAYAAVLQSADGQASNSTPPTSAHYAALGVNGMDSALKVGLLGEVIDGKTAADVDSVAKLQALADAVQAVVASAIGQGAPTLAQLQALGLTGVTAGNLSAVQSALAASADDGSGVSTLGALQTMVDACTRILAEANGAAGDADSAVNPGAADYQAMGVDLGLLRGNASGMALLQDVVASQTTSAVDTSGEVNALARAVQAVLSQALDATPAVVPVATDFALIGAAQAAALRPGSAALALFNDLIASASPAMLDSVAKIDALGSLAERFMVVAASQASALTANQALSPADFLALGISGVDSANLAQVLSAIANTANDGSQIQTLAQLQTLVLTTVRDQQAAVDAQARLQAYANDPANAAVPSLADYTLVGVSAVNADTRAFLNQALATQPFSGGITVQALQAMVDAYNRIQSEANGSANDLTVSDPTAASFERIGVDLGVAAQNTALGQNALALLNDVIGAQTTQAVHTVAQIDALASITSALLETAAGLTPAQTLTPADFALLGVTGVTAQNLNAVLAALVSTPDTGDAIHTLARLQSVVTSASEQAQAIGVLQAVVDTQSGNPNLNVWVQAGLIGVTEANRPALLDALKTGAISTVTPAALQAVLDAYQLVLVEANGGAPDASAVNPTAATFAAIGATAAASLADGSVAQQLLLDVIANAQPTAVDQVSKIDALAQTVQGLMRTAAGLAASPALSADDFAALGILGVDAANLAAVLASIAAGPDDGRGVLSLNDLQQSVSQVIRSSQAAQAAIAAALAVIAQAANDTAAPLPRLADYLVAGVSGVNTNNLAAINSVLASSAVQGEQVRTAAQIQAMVDAYALILAEANGAAADSTQANPQAATYAAIGATAAAALPDGSFGQQLLNQVIADKTTSAIDSVAEIEALAQTVQALLLTAAGGTPSVALNALDLQALGLSGVTPDNLSAILAALAATADNGAGVADLAALQNLVNTVRGDLLQVLQRYASSNSGAAPTLADWQRADVQGVDSRNVFALNSALASSAITGDAIASLPAVQALVDAYAGILAEANGPAADATPQSQPQAADFARVGAVTAAALSPEGLRLMDAVLADQPFYLVDSVDELQSLASTVDKLMGLADGQDPASPLTVAEMQALGMTGVQGTALVALADLLKSPAVNPSDLQSMADVRSWLQQASQSAALAVLTRYTQDVTAAAPAVADFAYAQISGVDARNLAAIHSALSSAAAKGAVLDTAAKVQAVVDAYARILAEANGTLVDATPDSQPTAADYATIGATTAAALTAPALALLNDSIANMQAADVSTVAQIEVLADTVQRLMAVVAGQAASLSVADLQRLGVDTTGMSAGQLAVVVSELAALADDGRDVARLSALQGLVFTVTDRLARVVGVQLSSDTGPAASDFITANRNQFISGTLNAPLGIFDRVYGRLDGLQAMPTDANWVAAGWTDLTAHVDGTLLQWPDAQLLAGPARSLVLQVVRDNGADPLRTSETRVQDYRWISELPARVAPLNAPVPEGGNPSPSGLVRLKVDNLPDGTANVVLLVDGRAVPSLFHVATLTLMPLSALPEGNWNLQYQFQDMAGNVSTVSPSLQMRIVSPQNGMDLESLDGDGVLFSNEKNFGDINGDGLDDADQRDVVTFQTSAGQVMALDTTRQGAGNMQALLSNPANNPGGQLRVEVQIDSVTSRAVTAAERAQALSGSQLGSADVFAATDVISFRHYPQVVRLGDVDEATVDALSAQVVTAYMGQVHEVDVKVAEGLYNTYFKVSSEGVWAFTWDEASGTGAKFLDTNSDGFIDLVRLFIRDGGRGDDDGAADGVVFDPGFVAAVREAPQVRLESFPVAADGVITADEAGQVNLSGSTTGVEAGQILTVVFSDGVNNVTATTTIDAQGRWALQGVDLRALSDGPVSLSLSVSNQVGDATALADTVQLDKSVPVIVPEPEPTPEPPISERAPRTGVTAWLEPLTQQAVPLSKDAGGPAAFMPLDELETSAKGRQRTAAMPSWMEDTPTTWARATAPAAPEDWVQRQQNLEREALRLRQFLQLLSESTTTQSEGLPVRLSPLDGVFGVMRGLPDLQIEAGRSLVFTLPPDTFVHHDPQAVVRLSVDMLDGQVAPHWVKVDQKTGVITLNPPDVAQGEVVLRLMALDQRGQAAVTVLRIKVGAEAQSTGRVGLSDKLAQSRPLAASGKLHGEWMN
ncbi:hypothetical protein [Limnohabitans planktonicus]|uniref:hypothetical protein n=1 Tax=Limnohabitans planktonicus TaxID=540060 RepID=UPI00197C1550|nr:hypothetical protein [Limnohabitans planktonicus]